MPKDFFELTNGGRAGRLRRLAQRALENYDLEVARLKLITNDFNGIFRVDTRRGEKFVLRVALPTGGHNAANFRSEMEWLHALSRDTNLGVPAPVAALTGERVIVVSSPGVPEPRCCMVFTWVPGRDLSRQLTEANVRKFGRLSARLHLHAQHFRPLADFKILRFDTLFPFPEPVLLFTDEFAHLFPRYRREVFELGLAQAQAALDRLKNSGEPMRVLHGDLHHWNVHVYRGRLYPFDFEDLMWGWPVQDIATTLYYWAGREDYALLLQAFKTGYVSAAPWPERYPGEINAFIALRGIGLANFILQDPNPDWQAETPEFINRTENLVRRLLSPRL